MPWVVNSSRFTGSVLKLNINPAKINVLFSTSEDEVQYSEVKSDALEPEEDHSSTSETPSSPTTSFSHSQGTNGKPGLISFYNRPYKIKDEVSKSYGQKKPSSLLWLMGPAVLVASFIFPSLYLRKIFSTVFEDSLLTGNYPDSQRIHLANPTYLRLVD